MIDPSDEKTTEPGLNTSKTAGWDVLVAGAGPAGVTAAIAAARMGAKTLLVEKHGILGGMLTAGGVLNIRQYTDKQKQIIGGIPAELADRIRVAGGTTHTPDEGLCVRHDPEITKYVLQETASEAGVQLLLHTLIAGAVTAEDAVTGIVTENKSGRGSLHALSIVDATGDGDIIHHSGAAYEKSDGELQPMTLTFIIGGAECWPEPMTRQTRNLMVESVKKGSFPTTRTLVMFPMFRQGEYYVNGTRIPGDCTDALDLTRGELEGRRQIMAIVEWLRANASGFENAYLQSTPAQVGLRESRRRCIRICGLNPVQHLKYTS